MESNGRINVRMNEGASGRSEKLYTRGNRCSHKSCASYIAGVPRRADELTYVRPRRWRWIPTCNLHNSTAGGLPYPLRVSAIRGTSSSVPDTERVPSTDRPRLELRGVGSETPLSRLSPIENRGFDQRQDAIAPGPADRSQGANTFAECFIPASPLFPGNSCGRYLSRCAGRMALNNEEARSQIETRSSVRSEVHSRLSQKKSRRLDLDTANSSRRAAADLRVVNLILYRFHKK